jgi:DNA polymerase III subunit epsilon
MQTHQPEGAKVKRQIFFDIHTTSRQPYADGRMVELACVEVINRKLTGHVFHYYLNPQKPVSLEQLKNHGLTDAFLADKPRFSALDAEFVAFIRDAELICLELTYSRRFIDLEIEVMSDLVTLDLFTDGFIEAADIAKNKFFGWPRDIYSLCRYLDIPVQPDNLKSALYRASLFVEVYQAMTSLPSIDTFAKVPYKKENAWTAYMFELCQKHGITGKIRFDYGMTVPPHTISHGGYRFRHQKGTMTEFEDNWFVRRVMQTNQLMFEERLQHGLLDLSGGEIIMTHEDVTIRWCTPEEFTLLFDDPYYADNPNE